MWYLWTNLVNYSRMLGTMPSGVLNMSKAEHPTAVLGNLFWGLTTHTVKTKQTNQQELSYV